MKLLKLFFLVLAATSTLLADINDDLIEVVKKGDVAQVEQLLNQGTNVNATDQNGRTALMVATQNGFLSVVQCLIEHGANVNVKNSSLINTALTLAIKNNNIEVVRCLVEHDADVDIHNRWGNTVLITAVLCNNDVGMVRYLIEHGASVNVRNLNGGTALMSARSLEVAQTLIDHGADIDLQTEEGDTALIFAIQRKNIDIVRCLVDHGADVSIHNRWGDTALSISSGKIHAYLASFEAFRTDPWAFTQESINLNRLNLLGELPFSKREDSEVQFVPLQQLLLWSITLNKEDIFEALLEEGVLTADNRMISLKLAVQLGRKEMVRTLLDQQTNSEDAIQVMQWAADIGYWDIATWLLMKQKGYGDIGI